LNPAQSHSRRGLAYGLAAYGFWGLAPLYFHAVTHVLPAEVMAHRIVWSVVLLGVVIVTRARLGDFVRCFRSRDVLRLLLVSTLLIGTNWFVFIYAVSSGQVLQTSLGYFATPLLNVLLGLVCFRERLRPAQWAAVALAAMGVLYFAQAAGSWPWIAMTLALSFGLYGLIRKVVAVDGLTGLMVETILLLPAALAFLVYRAGTGKAAWGADRGTDFLLILSGVVTTVPLIWFVQAARLLPLSKLAFLQYLSPSLAFLLAVAVFGEEFTIAHRVAFACIWSALALYTFDSLRARRRRTLPVEVEVEIPV